VLEAKEMRFVHLFYMLFLITLTSISDWILRKSKSNHMLLDLEIYIILITSIGPNYQVISIMRIFQNYSEILITCLKFVH